MTDERRAKPYLWASWLPPHLAGDRSCAWAPWYMAHYRFEKMPEDDEHAGRLAQWSASHADMVRARAAELGAGGWEVRVEDQNKMTVRGTTISVGAKPDVVAVRGQEVRVEDCKTGQRRGSDYWQVREYQLFLPHLRPELGGHEIVGAVVYGDGVLEVGPLPPEDQVRIVGAIAAIGEDRAGPERVPSYSECSFCRIAACPDRVIEEAGVVATEAF